MSTPAKNDRVISLKESDALNALPAIQVNPQALLARAIESGATVETLERLVTLAKDIRQVTAREAYFEAMANFQKRCPPIKKNKVMAVPGRPTYRYSDLGEILSAIGPLMGELGLSQSWRSAPSTKPNHLVKVCQIAHRLGHTEDSGPCEVPYGNDGSRMNPTQSVGSAETYAKRYSLCSVLGISPEDDDDAQSTTTGKRTLVPCDHCGMKYETLSKWRGPTADENVCTECLDDAKRKASIDDAVRQHPPANPPATDSPALVAESVRLFPDPQADVERERLLNEIKKLADKIGLKPKERGEAWITYVGQNVTPSQADPAALADLLKWLETRQAK